MIKIITIRYFCKMWLPIDQSSLLIGIQADLLDQVFSSSSLISLLLTESKSLIGLDKLPLSVDYDGLELISLPDQLLAISINFLLQLQVLLQQGVPFALALTFTPLVLID